MNLSLINHTIRELCSEIDAINNEQSHWFLLDEEDLLHEAAVCIFSSQMIFEVALGAAKCIRSHGLMNDPTSTKPKDYYQTQFEALLSKPVLVEINGEVRSSLPRFKNRLAYLLANTMEEVYGSGLSLHELLLSSRSGKHAREKLISKICGFGPKQASLFLRRIGYYSELAILDTHILDYLELARGINQKPGTLSRLSTYEKIEKVFICIANEFGYAISSVDLAMWVTMRVAKREALL